VKYWGGGEYTKAGVPDILACVGGQFMGIEIKAKHGKVSPLQVYNLKQIDRSGGCAILLFPDDFESFKKMVKLINAGNTVSMDIYNTLKERWWKDD